MYILFGLCQFTNPTTTPLNGSNWPVHRVIGARGERLHMVLSPRNMVEAKQFYVEPEKTKLKEMWVFVGRVPFDVLVSA